MMNRDDVTAVLGPVDDSIVAEVIRTGAGPEDLVEALAWIGNDDVLMREGRSRPDGMVARLIDLLETEDEHDAPAVAPGDTHQVGEWPA